MSTCHINASLSGRGGVVGFTDYQYCVRGITWYVLACNTLHYVLHKGFFLQQLDIREKPITIMNANLVLSMTFYKCWPQQTMCTMAKWWVWWVRFKRIPSRWLTNGRMTLNTSTKPSEAIKELFRAATQCEVTTRDKQEVCGTILTC